MACPDCGAQVPEGSAFCNRCGARLTPPPSEPERRVVTALFCDIVGSTPLGERTDPEELDRLLGQYFALTRGAIERQGGQVEKFIGDAVAALFGYPVGHEDDPARAVTAALDIAERVNDSGLGLEVRIGVNTGEVFARAGASPGDWTAAGDVMNTASRLQSAAPAMGVVVGARTQSAAAGAFEFAELPALQLKGKEAPVAAWRVIGPKSTQAAERNRASLVGREADLDKLMEAVARLDVHRGGVVLVEGEPGIGKSRLVREARQSAVGVTWLRGRSIETRDASGYRPFAELIRGWASSWELLSEQAVAIGLGRDEAGFLAMLAGLELDADLAARSADLDAEAMRPSLYRSVLAWLDALGRSGPVVLELEDWHWADTASAQLAGHVMPLVQSRPLLVLFVARPGFEPAEALSRVAGEAVERVHLEPLDEAAAEQLLAELVSGRDLPRHRIENALRRADGNPYFLHELSRFLTEQGDAGVLPDSVRAVVTARVDRLPATLRGLIRMAAVIGRTFSDELLIRLGREDEVRSQLGQLVATGLVEQVSDGRRRFVHALTREAVYEGIPVADRKRLHAEVAEVMSADARPSELPSLAYHLAQAEDWDAAATALLAAGEQAARLAADDDALEMYRAAIDAHERLPADRWSPLERSRIDRRVAEALVRLGRHEEAIHQVITALARLGLDFPRRKASVRLRILRELAPRFTGPPALPPPRATPDAVEAEIDRELELLGWITFFTDHDLYALATFMLTNRAARAGFLEGLAVGTFRSAIGFAVLGKEKLARSYLERAHEAADGLSDQVELARLKQGLSLVPIGLAGYEEARRAAELGLELGVAAGDLRSRGTAGSLVSIVETMHGDRARACEFAQEAVRVAEEGGERAIAGMGYATLAVAFHDDPRAAAAAARAGIDLAMRVPDFLMLTNCLGSLARAQLRLGDQDGAAASVQKGLSELESRGFRGWVFAPLFEAQAELALLELARDRNRSTRATSKRAVKQSLRQAHIARWFAVHAHTQAGTRAWLLGKNRTATRSFTLAETLAEQYHWQGALADASAWTIHCCTVAGMDVPSSFQARAAETQLGEVNSVTGT